MSPVSRGRTPRKNTRGRTGGRMRRGPRTLELLDRPTPGCACPVCRGEEVDFTDLIDALLADAASLVTSDDPVEAEVAGAALVSTVTTVMDQAEVLDDEAGDHVLVGGLIPAFEARASTEAMTVLLALGSVAPDPVGAAASVAGHRLARAGVVRPSWADELTSPVTVGECRRFADPAGTAAILAASFTRGGHSHALLVSVDGLDCGAATEIVLLDAEGMAEALAVIRSTRPGPGRAGGDDPGPVVEHTLDATEWRWHVENALEARAVHDHTDRLAFGGPDLSELARDDDEDHEDHEVHEDELDGLASYPVMAVLLRARLAAIPASSKPRPPHGGHVESPTIDLTALGHIRRQPTGGPPGRNGSASPWGGRAPKLPAKPARGRRPAPIYQLKIGIRHAKPPIWRRLQLSADTSLAALHEVIQIAFGWDDYHMHVFGTPYGEFGRADTDLGHRAEAPVTLEQVAPSVGDKIAYTYDFGDDWNLDITVEELLDAEPATSYPRCTGGRRAGPPEDSGGIYGYENLLAALADPGHPDHADMLDWLGCTDATDFDPARFDPYPITEALSGDR